MAAMGSQEAVCAIVVEDDPTVRMFLDRVLQRAGLESVGVGTAAEGLDHVRHRGPFAIALVDGLLPDLHGLELMRQFLAEPRAATMAICLLSGTVRKTVPVQAGISALGKPPRLAALLEHVDEMLQWRATGSSVSARRTALANLEVGLLVG
jgi:CheY-like chemotaxis protein